MNTTGKLFLLAFAVVPFASACRKKPVNAPAPKAVADSIARERARLDSIARADAENARAAAERAREENMRAQQQTRSVLATITAPIYFELDDADLTPEAVGVLEANEQGSDEYNLALGMRRAAEAKRFLVERGIAEGRIEVATRGEEEPAVSGHGETAWSRNRRDEFVVLGGSAR
jgi:peptidoglycan-associated lipoprotein